MTENNLESIKYAIFSKGEGILLNQTHSNKFCNHTKTNDYNADGHIFSNDDKRTFVIKTADCMPIFIYGKNFSAFLHVGHKGLRNGILKEKEIALIEPIYAYIGPSICKKCYQVGDGFDQGFITKSEKIDGKLYFDLQKEAMMQLNSYHIEMKISKKCTFEDISLYSHRRNDKLRNFFAIKLF